MQTFSFSLKSLNHLDDEDTVIALSNGIILADGMGGEKDGYKASHLAGSVAKEYIESTISSLMQSSQIQSLLAEAAKRANSAVRQQLPSSGTTLSIALVIENQTIATLYFANTGDSRIYLQTNNQLTKLTHDQNLLRAFYENRYEIPNVDKQYVQQHYEEINKNLDSVKNINDFNTIENFFFVNRNIVTGGVGIHNNLWVDVGALTVQPKDIVILTSDGVHDNLTLEDIKSVIQESQPTNIAEELVKSAYENATTNKDDRSKIDDISCGVIVI